MANALKTLFTEIAEVIRESFPNETNISPYNFPAKIREVAAVGGGSGSAGNVVLLESNLSFWTEGDGLYAWSNTSDNVTFSPVFDLTVGKKYNVIWDGQLYTCTAFAGTLGELNGVAIGNPILVGGDDTGEPFIIGSVTGSDATFCFTAETDETHTVKITEVASGSGSSGSSSSNLVKYVTFMSWDGSTELFKKPIISGDDCVDPVAKGLIEIPTRESTDAQNFTYSGWTEISGGNADSNALKNITEDKIVYAAFTASVRYYTVTYMDDDGVTVFNTVEATYGADVSDYTPIKDGYTLVGWEPAVDNITGDIVTTAVWEVDQGWLVPMANVDELPTTGVAMRCMEYTPDGTKLIVADFGKRLIMYDTTTKPYTKLYTVTPNSSKAISDIAISPDGTTLLVCFNYAWNYYNTNMYVYKIEDNKLTKKSNIFPTANTNTSLNPFTAAFNPQGTEVAINMSTYIYIFNTTSSTSWTLKKKFSVGINRARPVYSTNGTKLFVMLGKTISVYDVENDYADVTSELNGNQNTTITGTDAAGGDIAITPDGRFLICGGVEIYNQYNSLYKIDTSTTPYTFTVVPGSMNTYGNIRDVSISPDGSMFAITMSKAPYMIVFDTETMTPKELPETQISASGYACSFNHDGTELAVSGYQSDPTMIVYQVKK